MRTIFILHTRRDSNNSPLIETTFDDLETVIAAGRRAAIEGLFSAHKFQTVTHCDSDRAWTDRAKERAALGYEGNFRAILLGGYEGHAERLGYLRFRANVDGDREAREACLKSPELVLVGDCVRRIADVEATANA